jgi:hypothetical protein
MMTRGISFQIELDADGNALREPAPCERGIDVGKHACTGAAFLHDIRPRGRQDWKITSLGSLAGNILIGDKPIRPAS